MKRFVAVNMDDTTFKKLETLKKDNEFNSNTELLKNLLEENITINEVKLNETYDNVLIAIMEAEKEIILLNNDILNFLEWCLCFLIIIVIGLILIGLGVY